MAYIGQVPANLGQSTSEDTFTATAGQTVFTLTADVERESNIIVSINGVVQTNAAFALSGTGGRTLTFVSGITLNDVVRVVHIGYKPTTYIPGADAIDGTHIVDNAINSEHYTDGSIDLAHMSVNSIDSDQYVDGSVDLAHLAADSVDGTKIADDAINSEHYTDGSIDLAHMSVNSIDSDQYVDGSIDAAHLSANSIDSASYVDGSIDLAHMSVNSIDSDQYVDGSIDLAHLAADSVDGTKIADNAINSEHYTDGSIDTAHIAINQIDETLIKDAFVADFTDATVTAADTFLHGDATDTTITASDTVVFADATDSNALKEDTVQGILDLVPAGHTATVGKHTIWVPALAMFGSDTAGADLQTVETTATRPDLKVLDFDPGTREHAQFSVAFPKSWNLGTVTFKPFWSPSNTNTSNCIWALQGVAVSDNDTADVAYGGAQTSTDGIGTIEDVQVGPESSAITIDGSPADADLCFFQVYRDAASGSDGFTGDARLLGVKLFFTTDAENDA